MGSEAYFKEVAGSWDTMREGFFSEAVRDKAYITAGVKKGETAADIGCGTGFLTEGLLQRGLNVMAVDQSNEMLAQMKQKFKDYPSVEYLQGDAKKLPIDNGKVDYVMANMFLHHVDNPLDAIKEMVRILKPGGKLIITDLDKHNFEFLRTEQHDQWLGFDRSDVENWFLEAGLVNVLTDCAGGNCCSASCTCSEKASISIFIAVGEK